VENLVRMWWCNFVGFESGGFVVGGGEVFNQLIQLHSKVGCTSEAYLLINFVPLDVAGQNK
jgi:hypothetical protein